MDVYSGLFDASIHVLCIKKYSFYASKPLGFGNCLALSLLRIECDAFCYNQLKNTRATAPENERGRFVHSGDLEEKTLFLKTHILLNL